MATIMLDAGHGGYDSGAVYGDRYEKNDTLSLVLAVGTILENNGVDVLYTRTTDVYQSPNEKAGIANRSDADYFISIHRNSSPDPNTYSGVETLVYRDSGIPAVFAQNINNELARIGFANLGTEERPNLAVLRGTRMPAALVEVGSEISGNGAGDSKWYYADCAGSRCDGERSGRVPYRNGNVST